MRTEDQALVRAASGQRLAAALLVSASRCSMRSVRQTMSPTCGQIRTFFLSRVWNDAHREPDSSPRECSWGPACSTVQFCKYVVVPPYDGYEVYPSYSTVLYSTRQKFYLLYSTAQHIVQYSTVQYELGPRRSTEILRGVEKTLETWIRGHGPAPGGIYTYCM